MCVCARARARSCACVCLLSCVCVCGRSLCVCACVRERGALRAQTSLRWTGLCSTTSRTRRVLSGVLSGYSQGTLTSGTHRKDSRALRVLSWGTLSSTTAETEYPQVCSQAHPHRVGTLRGTLQAPRAALTGCTHRVLGGTTLGLSGRGSLLSSGSTDAGRS